MITNPDYRVEANADRNLIKMTFIGFWDEVTAKAFGTDLDHAMDVLTKAGNEPGSFICLVDFRQSAIHSPAMVARLTGFADTVGIHARRVAIIVAGALQKMQLQRVTERYDHYGFFQTGEDAEAWLISS